ncbi:MAG TPA: energy-coupling factor transporter transmembrane component T [Gemmatimonadales bacterium]
MTLARRAHPFTTGAVALTAVTLALLLADTQDVIVLYLVTVLVAVATGAGAGVRRGLYVVVPIWALLFILQVLLGLDPRTAAPWGGTMSVPGVQFALSQGSRLAVIATASLAFATTFDPQRFLQASIARGWPFGAAFLLVATLDAADRLASQARQLREAQRTRGVMVSGSLATRARALPALIFPLLLTSLTEADDRALALDTRGLLLTGRRTAIDPPADSPTGRALRWLMLVLVIAAAVWRVRR